MKKKKNVLSLIKMLVCAISVLVNVCAGLDVRHKHGVCLAQSEQVLYKMSGLTDSSIFLSKSAEHTPYRDQTQKQSQNVQILLKGPIHTDNVKGWLASMPFTL